MNKEDAIRYIKKMQTWYLEDPANDELLIIARPYWRSSGRSRIYAPYREKWYLKGTFDEMVENFIQKCEVFMKTATEELASCKDLRNLDIGIQLTVWFSLVYVEDGEIVEEDDV